MKIYSVHSVLQKIEYVQAFRVTSPEATQIAEYRKVSSYYVPQRKYANQNASPIARYLGALIG